MESIQHREPWNKGKLVGQKPPLKHDRPQRSIRQSKCYLAGPDPFAMNSLGPVKLAPREAVRADVGFEWSSRREIFYRTPCNFHEIDCSESCG